VATEYKYLTLIDECLISGSAASDPLRTSLGCYVQEEQLDETFYGEEKTFVFYINDSSETDEEAITPTDPNTGIAHLFANYELIEDASSYSMLNSYKMPLRIVENLSFGFEDNEHWDAFLFGGIYNDTSYEGILINNSTYIDHSIRGLRIPFSNYTSKMINHGYGDDYGCATYKVQPNYTRHYVEYNTYSQGVAQERALPNAYMLQSIFDNAGAIYDDAHSYDTVQDKIVDLYGKNTWRYVSIEGMYPDHYGVEIDNILTDEVIVSNYLPDHDSAYAGPTGYQADDTSYGLGGESYYDTDLYLRNYFSASIPQFASFISASVYDRVYREAQNVLFDQEARKKEMLTVEDNIDKFPMYFEVSFESLESSYGSQHEARTAAGYSIKKALTKNSYDTKFLSDLKAAFDGTLRTNDDRSIVTGYNFRAEHQNVSSSANYRNIIDSAVNKIAPSSLRVIDFNQFLNYSCINNINTGRNHTSTYIVGPLNSARKAAIATSPQHRHFNTANFARFFNDLKTEIFPFFYDSFDKGAYPTEALRSVYQIPAGDISVSGEVGTEHGQAHKYTEVLAYRIEKTRNVNTIGASAPPIQNFWIFEDEDPSGAITKIYDTQVKKDTHYTYNIYAYILVAGAKYGIKDVVRSAIIGNVDESDESFPGYYCIQWLDQNDSASDALYDQTHAEDLSEINTYADGTTGIAAPDDYRYMADFNLIFEPSVKIIEVPIGSKKAKIMDNPPNRPEVNPFQIMNNSQTLGFEINYSSFATKRQFSEPLSGDDQLTKAAYEQAFDIITERDGIDEQVDRRSVSKQRYVEVYRLDHKPSTMLEFENRAISIIDLKEEKGGNYLSQAFFYDRINTNLKYYYVFRFLNENRIPGPPSHIIEIELIDDGGFKYSIVDSLLKQDLAVNQDTYTRPSESFKKLFMVYPAQQQMSMDTKNSDFSQPAHSQLDTIDIGDPDLMDTIWGETFKFRLTSKKTGKKIDLNITYKNITNSE
jgi:hypothetical protein